MMYNKQGMWKMLDAEEGYAKPNNKDWGVAKIFHLFPLSSQRSRLGGKEEQDSWGGDEGKE